MATRLEQWSKEEVRAVIHFLHVRHVSVAKIHSHLVEVYREEVMSCQSVVKRCSGFKSGQVGTMDESSGRQATISTPKNKACI